MFYDLLEEVWAQFRVDVFLYVREWLMHILAHPEAKVPSSLAIRGEQGDGKSLVFERCMARILGPLMLVVANHNLVLGNYNEAVMGKLLIVLEEATFAGDKAAFDNMKQVITGEQITVNPKYKSPITVDNYARVVVVSNHLHFLQREAADRRYTVIETVGAWQGTSKFEQLVDQWNNGGAERFLYEALNHDFRKLDGGDRLVISRNIPTEAGIRQVAHSRTLVQRFVVEWLLGGNIGGKYSSDQKRFPAWDLDAECEVPSKHIESNLREWLKENEHHGSQRAVPLSAIMIEVERYFGETRGKRSKTQADVMTGKRANSPTMRVLPPRRAAIENARAQGLITQEEYDAALPAPGDEQDTSGQ